MELPEWVSRLIELNTREFLRDENPGRAFCIFLRAERSCFFNGDDPLQLIRQVPGLLAFQMEAREAWPALADLDPFACNLRLQGISAGSPAELANIFRLVPDQVRIVQVPLAALRLQRVRPAQGNDTAGLIRIVIEEQRHVLRVADHGEDMAGRVGAVSRTAANALRHGHRPDLADVSNVRARGSPSERNAAALVSALEQTLESLVSYVPTADPEIAAALGPADHRWTIRASCEPCSSCG